jgi:hypothetical protein
LIGILFEKGCLHRMQVAGRPDALDSDDLVSLVSGSERQASEPAATIDVHRAGAALPMVATLLCPGKVKGIAKAIQQRGTWVDLHHAILTINAQRYGEPTSIPVPNLWGRTPLNFP